ncbi:MAG: acetate/propionate family kinase [Faecousia sp.]
MKILICNAGSTSLKFKLYEMPSCEVLATGKVERVGSVDDAIFGYTNIKTGFRVDRKGQNIPDYQTGIHIFLSCLVSGEGALLRDVKEIERVGFKSVLAKNYFGVHEIDDQVLAGMRDWIALAPIHNSAYLKAIEVMRQQLPDARLVGVFETSFHQSIPLERKIYGIPYEWYEKYGVQRLGFHGASHGYIADVLNAEKSEYGAISCHLGGSASICAIRNGKSVDTSFGMSLESGLIHNNRVGDMDTSISYFLKHEGLSDEQILEGFQKKGGLLGISGVSNDLRYVMEAAEQGSKRAKLAVDVFVTGIVHYIGAFYLDLGRLDYLVFTAGIGEHSYQIRSMVCQKLEPLGVKLDEEANQNCSGSAVISAPDSKVFVRVIPTDEELGIARRTYELK